MNNSPGTAPLELADQIVLAGAGAALLLGGFATTLTGLATTLAGSGWHPAPAGPSIIGLLNWPRHLTNPAQGYPDPAHTALPGPGGMWTALLLLSLLVTAVTAAGWRLSASLRAGPGGRAHLGRGLASRKELTVHLGERAVRARAAQTRPSLTGRFSAREAGLSLGRELRSGLPLWGSVEDSYLILGPPRSGKGVHLVIPHTLHAPGAVLVTSTRPDTLHATAATRAQRGPVLAFDPQALAPDAPRLRWSPTRGCEDPLVAINRARALSAGASMTKGSTSDGEFWQQMTAAVLRGYLHAAALTGRPVSDVLAWASRPSDPTPVRILRSESAAASGWAEELAAQAGADPRQRDSVWSGVRRSIDSLADPRVLQSCTPTADSQFQPEEFLREHGTVYLLGSTGTQLSVAPLITALLEDLLDTARVLAASCAHGRLDPPLLLLLDEAANIAPIPSLPNLLADGGGTGITTVAVLQSLAQARARWGDAGADSMWDAATTKVVLGGLAHADDLHRISRLAGDVDVPHVTHSRSSGGHSRSTSTQRLPALPLEHIRCLPAGQALVLARRCPPAQVRLTPWWQHPTQTGQTRSALHVRSLLTRRRTR
jgi:type IV secretion system protein VirD4